MARRTPIRPIRHDGRDYLTTAQVARLLGVKVESVYAYVSRGMLQSTRLQGVRGSVFPLAEVQALAEHSGRGRTPAGTVERITTELTLIDGDELFYRGQQVPGLATSASFPEVADLLWNVEHSPAAWAVAHDAAARLAPDLAAIAARLPATAGSVDLIRTGVGWIGASDRLRHFVSAGHTIERARIVVSAMATMLAGYGRAPEGDPAGESAVSAYPDDADLVRRLWDALGHRDPDAAELAVLRAALILMADHDLAASTVAARVAASARASIYAVLAAGLGALDGPLHGGSGRQCLRYLTAALDDPDAALAEALSTATSLPGWGQVIYRERDPRADVLLGMLSRLPGADLRAVAAIDACREVQAATERPFPNIDLALAAMTLVLGLRPDTPETVFAISRMIGWTAHALEEYLAPPLRFRPVGVYVGIRPGR